MPIGVTHDSDGTTVINFEVDHLDAGNANEIRRSIQNEIGKNTHLIIDMRQLQFVDSSGLGVLIATLRLIDKSNGTLRLCCMTEPVQALFDLMRMHRLFQIHNSVEEANRSW